MVAQREYQGFKGIVLWLLHSDGIGLEVKTRPNQLVTLYTLSGGDRMMFSRQFGLKVSCSRDIILDRSVLFSSFNNLLSLISSDLEIYSD